ncbi:MAG: phosphoenolpyruvate--protein phosphotransferase [bacterium]|nr:phosphoenolpyruvate--protein phosphotransferase [bacterium]
MERFEGKSILKKLAVGKIYYMEKNNGEVTADPIDDPQAEVARFEQAKEQAIATLQQLYEKTCEQVGEDEAMIFEVHQMLMEDEDYVDAITEMITGEKVCAQYAVHTTGETFAQMFEQMDDAYMQARSADMRDISQRLVRILCGEDCGLDDTTEPVILVAEDLLPSETVQLDRDKLLGFVTRLGSANSHTAILARTMNVPALIGVEIDASWNGKTAIIDGYEGCFVVDPDETTLSAANERLLVQEEEAKLLAEQKGQPTVTKSGRQIHLYANIGNVEDVNSVLEQDAEGIGLFRSEFIYLGTNDFPSEEEQFEVYRTVLERMGEKRVIIRTLDIGADKQVDYFGLDHEENPAMGLRAIRICLTRPEIFRTQLRALYRASAYGRLGIMFPMIISVDELRKIKEIIKEVTDELAREQIAVGEVELGIMIETPAAVMMSRELAKEVDFFSIGTNDLTQYTLAIDRQNDKLDAFYDAHHPAVLRMIQMTIENGHAGGAWVGICGELGADPTLTKTFVEMGIDELSVAASAVLPIRRIIRGL